MRNQKRANKKSNCSERSRKRSFFIFSWKREIIYDLLSFQVNLLGLKTKDAELEKQPRSRSSLPLEGFFTRKTTSRSFSMLFTWPRLLALPIQLMNYTWSQLNMKPTISKRWYQSDSRLIINRWGCLSAHILDTGDVCVDHLVAALPKGVQWSPSSVFFYLHRPSSSALSFSTFIGPLHAAFISFRHLFGIH